MADKRKTVVLVDDETGESFNAPSDKVKEALKRGFRHQTPDEAKADADKEKYGTGILPAVGAAALGAARTLTLGGSDALIGAAQDIRDTSLVTPDLGAQGPELPGDQPREKPTDIRAAAQALREHQPTATTVGELGGFLVPALGELGALGKAGKAVARVAGAPLGALTEGGTAVGAGARAVAEAVPGLGRLAPAIGGAAKLGAEAGAFQVGQNVSDAALEDHELNAETILSHVGTSATLGGGIGAAIPLFGAAARAAAEKVSASELAPVQWAKDKASKAVQKFFDPDRATALYAGAMSKGDLLRDTVKGKRFQSAVHDLREGGFFKGGTVDLDVETGKIVQAEKGALPSQQQAYERLQALADKAGTAMGETLRTADEAAAGKGGSIVWGADDTAKLSAKIDKWQKTVQITPSEADRLRATLAEIENGVNASEGKLQDMHAIRRGLDARIGPKNFEKLGGEEIELVKDIRRQLSTKISDRMEALGNEGVIPKNTVTRWKSLNKVYGDLKTIEAPLDWQRARAEANVNVGGLRWRDLLAGSIGASAFGPVGALAGVGNAMLQTEQGLLARAAIGERVQRSAWMTKLREQAAKQRTSAVKSLVTSEAGDGAAVLQRAKAKAPDDATFARLLEASEPVAAKMTTKRAIPDHDWWTQVQGRLTGVIAEPGRELARLNRQAGELDPDTRQAVVRKQMQVLSYLAERMPKSGRQPFFNEKWRPDPGTLRDFQRVAAVATDPNQIYALVASGRVSRPQIDAVKALYPSTFAQLQAEVQREIVERGEKGDAVSYKAQLRLGQLLGAPLNYSQTPEFRQALTAATKGTQTPTPETPQASSGPTRASGRINVASKQSSTMSVANR